MRKKAFNVFVVLLVLVFGMQTFTATGRLSPQEVYDKYAPQLGYGTQKEMQLEEWVGYMQYDMYQEFYDLWINNPGVMGYGADNIVTEILLNEGYYTEYVDHLKEAGIIRADYELPKSAKSSTTTNSTAQPTPESITTTKCEEKTMWAKSEVNVRENGSTSYKKVASLKKDEQVTVTGVDSTGWYEIRLADGTVGHVSDKYLTEVQPSVNTVSTDAEGKVPEETPTETATPQRQSEIISIDGRTVVWYNAETGREEEVTFSDSTPLDEVEEFANTYLINGAELVESTPEPTEEPEETPVPTETMTPKESPVATPTVDPSTEPEDNAVEQFVQGPVFIFGSIIIGVIALVAGIAMMMKAKKRR